MKLTLKATMFQAMACMDGFDIDVMEDIKDESPKECIMLHKPLVACPGSLGERAELSVLLRFVEPYKFGSIQLKLLYQNVKYSILIFKSGKMKISGGCGHISDNDILHITVSKVANLIATWVKAKISSVDISLINGQFTLNKMTIIDLKKKIEKVAHHFKIIKKPLYDIPGRRGAYKLYMFTDRKFHVAVDTGGCCQIFAAKKYNELLSIYNIMNDKLSL